MQRLLGTVNWITPLLGISNETVHPLFQLLKVNPTLNSKRLLTPAVQQALQEVATTTFQWQAQQYHPALPFHLIVLNPDFQPYALVFQWDNVLQDPLLTLEWIILPHQFSKTITIKVEMISALAMQEKQRLLSLSGSEPLKITLPVSTTMLQWVPQCSLSFQVAIEGFEWRQYTQRGINCYKCILLYRRC